MGSVLKQWAQDPLLQQELRQLTRSFVQQRGWHLSRGLKARLAAVTCGRPESAVDREELLDNAAAELWLQIMLHADEAEVVLVQSIRDARNGAASDADIWEQLFLKAWSWLDNALMEQSRSQSRAKKNYKSLQNILHKSDEIRQDKTGTNYGPASLPDTSPVFAVEREAEFGDIPAFARVGQKDLASKFSREHIVPLALHFWQAVIDRRCRGLAHFVPIFALHRWMDEHYGLSDLRQVQGRRNEDGTYASPLDDLDGGLPTPEEAAGDRELQLLAKDFALSLPEDQRTYCALYYADENARLEDVAARLGYKSPSGLHRLDKKFKAGLRDYILRQDCFEDGTRTWAEQAQAFLDAVCQACRQECEKSCSGAESTGRRS